MFETASFHITKSCNAKCKFCYATFDDIKQRQLPIDDAKIVLDKLNHAGLKKITFAGGEPLLYKKLPEVISYAKKIGLTTSIITNGKLLTERFLSENSQNLDWVGISIDSLNPEVNKAIGRGVFGVFEYNRIMMIADKFGLSVKVNTVVNKFNQHETIKDFIEAWNIKRWKVFDTLKVEGQNDYWFDYIKPDKNAFNLYVERNKCNAMVAETNELMTGSYMLIDAEGRLFENSLGKHTYSPSLVTNDLNSCLSSIKLNRKMFLNRGGIYEW